LRSFRRSPVEPRSLVSQAGYDFFQALTRSVFRLFFGLRLSDAAALPDGPVLLAANHRSFIDPLVLGGAVDRRVTYMMHARFYDKPALNWFFRMARCIVVEDSGENTATLRAALEVLAAGKVVGIFPEGHISRDGRLAPLEPGLAFLARRSDAPVVPVWISGTREVLPRGARWPRRARLRVSTGRILRMRDFPEGRAGQAAFLQAVHAELVRLSRGEAQRREHH